MLLIEAWLTPHQSYSTTMLCLKPESDHHYHFVTGKLAAASVRDLVDRCSREHGFSYSIQVLPITVAALITPKWLLRHLDLPSTSTHLVVPGYCEVGLDTLKESVGIPVVIGPKDCREIPRLFGEQRRDPDLSDYSIEVIAEINHVPRKSVREVVRIAEKLIADGADRIDLGCDPSEHCSEIGDYVNAVRALGVNVSIDSFDPDEVEAAVRAGASLVLSVNASNREIAADWDCEVVVIPDSLDDLSSFDESVDYLTRRGVSVRLDSILEPIGAGLMSSLTRYAEVRSKYPELPMMMGIGNVTELTDVDSAGINLILLAICEELRIGSVLTTEVINWARSSVRECEVARRLVHHSLKNRIPPKRLSEDLVMLRDGKLLEHPEELFENLAATIKDHNYRLYAQDEKIHVVSSELWLSDRDPFHLFDQLLQQEISSNIDAGHAFYLGYEMAKASIALTLGKQYEQDRALNWGLLTAEEDLHRIQRTSRAREPKEDR